MKFSDTSHSLWDVTMNQKYYQSNSYFNVAGTLIYSKNGRIFKRKCGHTYNKILARYINSTNVINLIKIHATTMVIYKK